MRNETHLGVPATYNRGFALAKGVFILATAADDYILPGFFEKAMAAVRAAPAGGAVHRVRLLHRGRGRAAHRERPRLERPAQRTSHRRRSVAASGRICRSARSSCGATRSSRPAATGPNWRGIRTGSPFSSSHSGTGLIHLPETLGIHVLNAGFVRRRTAAAAPRISAFSARFSTC